jgi:hypothetical protein
VAPGNPYQLARPSCPAEGQGDKRWRDALRLVLDSTPAHDTARRGCGTSEGSKGAKWVVSPLVATVALLALFPASLVTTRPAFDWDVR